ncbi:hypothetical protein Tco_0413192 [Tanacetum coccineum]
MRHLSGRNNRQLGYMDAIIPKHVNKESGQRGPLRPTNREPPAPPSEEYKVLLTITLCLICFGAVYRCFTFSNYVILAVLQLPGPDLQLPDLPYILCDIGPYLHSGILNIRGRYFTDQ